LQAHESHMHACMNLQAYGYSRAAEEVKVSYQHACSL